MTIYLTAEKAMSVQQISQTLLHRQTYSIRDAAQVIGKIVSTFPGNAQAPILQNPRERLKCPYHQKFLFSHLILHFMQ